VDIFTLGSNFVQFTAHFVGLGGVLVVVIVVIAIIVFFLDTRDASVFGVDGLQESMRKLHLVTITILEVVLDILAGINSHTFFISKDTNLDLGSVAGADGSSIKSLLAIVFGVVDHLTFKKVGGINISILFHVLDLLALLVASVTVNTDETTFSIVLLVFILLFLILVVTVVVVLVIVTVVLAVLAHGLLELLLVLDSGLEVSLKVNDVLSVVGVARAAVAIGTETEDDKALGGKDSGRVFIISEVITVSLDELALFELERVGSQVNVLFKLTGGPGSLHKLGHISRLGVVAAGWAEGAGADGSSHEKCKSGGEVHDY
jgi:hypothetical protein